MGNRAEVELGFEDKEIAEGLRKAEARFEHFGKKVQEHTSGKGGHGGHHEEFSEKLEKFQQGLIAAESLHKFHELTEHFDTINKLAIRLNTSVESVQRLDVLARMADTDVMTLAKGIEKVVRNLEEAESDPKVAKALKTLKLSSDELKAAGPEEQILMIGDALEHAREHGDGTAATFNLIGKVAGELTPLLLSAREELDKMQGRHFLGTEDVKALADFNDNLKDAGIRTESQVGKVVTQVSELGAVIAATIDKAGSTGDIVESFTEVLHTLRESKREAAVEADERERAAKAAREEKVWTDKIAEAQASNEKGAKEMLKTDEEREKQEKEALDHLRESIAAQREHNIEAANSPIENLLMKEAELLDLEKQLKSAQQEGYELPEKDQLELIKKIAATKGQIVSINKEISAEEEKTREAAKKHAAAAGDLKAELQILRERIAGHGKQADLLQKELDLKKEARQIAEELGISEKQALAIAKEKAALEDKLHKKHDGRIHGYTGPTTTGPNGPGSGLDWLKGHGIGGPRLGDEWKYPGLDRYKEMQHQKMTGHRPGEDNKHRDVSLTNGSTVEQLLNKIAEGVCNLNAY